MEYYKRARDNEPVFRNILRDLRDNREKRPMGFYIPKDLESEADLKEIFERYSEGQRSGIFTIDDFTMPDRNSATISFKDIAPLSGGGAELEYLVRENGSVKYKRPISTMMS